MAILDADARRHVPQPLSLRPSLRNDLPAGSPAGRPDALMIDWGAAPAARAVTLYWPGVRAIEVVRLGWLLQAGGALEVVDTHTVRLPARGRLGFVPIPFSEQALLPGLLTLELAAATRKQPQRLVVRRVGSDRAKGDRGGRRVIGTFAVEVPHAVDADLLPPEENALAILRWRLARTGAEDPWRPVLERFVAATAARVDAFGGDAAGILPSPLGIATPPAPRRAFTGWVREVLFDGEGAFAGFVLETERGHRRRFAARAPGVADLVLRLCGEDRRLTVVTAPPGGAIVALIVRG